MQDAKPSECPKGDRGSELEVCFKNILFLQTGAVHNRTAFLFDYPTHPCYNYSSKKNHGGKCMHYYEYGKENDKTIVFLHGANFVHSFGRQYPLAEKYHLIIPHIMGYGDAADEIFDTETAVKQLASFIADIGKKVTLVGFSLGAQLSVKLCAEYPQYFTSAIIVSPWLIKKEPMLSNVMAMNEKQFASFKNKRLCGFIGFMNGLPKEQRKEFVAQMQNVRIETVRSSVDNGITLETINGFENAYFPMIALAGSKEQTEVHDSVKGLAAMNKNCRYEIWDKAAHNIPPVFSKRFNELIIRMAEI